MLPLLSGIGSDSDVGSVVLTPGNFQAYPELLFSFLYSSTRYGVWKKNNFYVFLFCIDIM